MIKITPLDAWIRNKTSIGSHIKGRAFVEALNNYQLKKVSEVIEYARRKTTFYRRHLSSLPTAPCPTLSTLDRVPFTKPLDLISDPFSFLAVRQDDVTKIVTLRTSGSTGEAKRLFFTDEDLEQTLDFFHHGMSTLVRPGQKVAILLPGDKPNSVGDLLFRSLQRMNVQALVYGPVKDALHAGDAVASFGAHCLVGIPAQVLGMASLPNGGPIGKGRIESVLLTTDYVPRALKETLRLIWGCRVFTHYGMTEMGLGGGVECEALDGYHLRESDLYFEVVNHETGKMCPDGTTGEVVFTTLTKRGMPLIRYRTGDIASIMPQPCPCGSALRRMGCIKGRQDNVVSLGPGCALTLPDMDEALFRLPGLLDYQVTASRGAGGRIRLHIDIHKVEGAGLTDHDILQMLNKVEAIRKGINSGCIDTPIICFSEDGRSVTTGVLKRKIVTMDDPIA